MLADESCTVMQVARASGLSNSELQEPPHMEMCRSGGLLMPIAVPRDWVQRVVANQVDASVDAVIRKSEKRSGRRLPESSEINAEC